ncbi:ATP-binding protein [uncultured Draconibacterium sp.]|uniref:sensor histidine kinase n=1 Tax=uncultured Draconibacterium sp. TaxID=1573823 RepID=UPI0029C61B84|nr:ATP-binding protein [uncultured Draconibacterium sp.]
MIEQLNLDLLTKTVDDLTVGVGIFHVPDFNNIKDIRYVFMNKVILYEMRKTREEVFGKKIIEVAPEAYEHEGGLLVIETYRKVAEEGGSINLGLVEYSNHMVSGTYECSVHHIQDHYVYVQLRNVTELEKVKNELLEKNQELEQFAYITSHDLQEPLNSIISFSHLLEEEKNKLGELGQQSIDIIKGSAYRMKDFIISLLEYSQIGRKREKAKVDIVQLIENLKVDLHDLISKKHASITYLGKPLSVFAYETDLIKLIQNLVVNGIKYTDDQTPPVITINAEEHDDEYQFSVADNGIGIAKEQFENIFKVFQRLHSRENYSGNGIGLSHCKKVVELHGGKIWLSSEEGKGTTFYFTLPK